MNRKWFALSIDQIEEKLNTNAASGLTIKEARSRKGKDTPFFTVRRKGIGLLAVELVSEIFMILLALISFFSIFFSSGRVHGISAIIVIAVNLLLSFLIHFIGVKSVESMTKLFLPTVKVIRGGKLYILDYSDVVVGDVIVLERGDVIGVDARLVYSDALKVRMQVDKKEETDLEKYANSAVNPSEIYAVNMSNMVHAGSIVLEGGGRAIVTATGQYTYLGSITGGMRQDVDDSLPEPVKVLQKKFSRLGLILLLAVFPFCVVSVLLSNFITGATATLPVIVITVLMFCAIFRLASFSTLFVHFFNRYLRKLAVSDNPCIFRSANVLDKVAETDYIFLLDGAVATDGILHFEALETVDGALKDLDSITGSARALFNMVTIYAQAREAMPTVGVKSFDVIDSALDELRSKSRFDRAALRIRCSINSYLPGAGKGSSDVIAYTELGERKEMYVSNSSLLIEQCNCALVSSEIKAISESGVADIKKAFFNNLNSGKRPIVFVSVMGEQICFVGMLVLREGLDYTSVHAVNEFRRNGIQVISFSNCHDRDASIPEIPDLLKSDRRASYFDFKRREIPATFEFGNYDEYVGFGEEDIYQLAKLVKSQGKILTVIGFSEYAEKAIDVADVFVSCAPIKTRSEGRFSEEVTAGEIPSTESSASCMQTVKTGADVLLMRPKSGKGGLEPMMRAMEYCRMAYRNLNRFFIYLFAVQIMRFIVIIFPLLYGHVFADARQLVLPGLFFDLFALILFMTNSSRAGNSVSSIKRMYTDQKLLDVVKKYKSIILCAIIGGVSVILIPSIFNYFNFLGGYNHTGSFAYIALMMLQFVLFAGVYLVDLRRKGAIKHLLNRKFFFLEIAIFLIVTAAAFFFTPIGNLFGLTSDFIIRSPFYFMLSFVPAIIFAFLHIAIRSAEESNRNIPKREKMTQKNRNNGRKM